MSNKKSSVELFAIALYEGGYLQGNGDEINDLLERHKAKHEEEIVDSIVQYEINHYHTFTEKAILNTVKIAEKYYKQTYGGNK
jgi:predicted SprT family Zn-dependent metalloprotease